MNESKSNRSPEKKNTSQESLQKTLSEIEKCLEGKKALNPDDIKSLGYFQDTQLQNLKNILKVSLPSERAGLLARWVALAQNLQKQLDGGKQFQKAIFQRISSWDVLKNEKLLEILNEFIRLEKYAKDWWFAYVSKNSKEYYPSETFQDLAIHFHHFYQEVRQLGLTFPKLPNGISLSYDHGGKIWLDNTLFALEKSRLPQEQLDLIFDLPSELSEIKEGFERGFPIVTKTLLKFYPTDDPLSKRLFMSMDKWQLQYASLNQLKQLSLAFLISQKKRLRLETYYEIIDQIERAPFNSNQKSLLLNIVVVSTTYAKAEGSTKAFIEWTITGTSCVGDTLFLYFLNKGLVENPQPLKLITQVLQQLCDLSNETVDLDILLEEYNAKPSLTDFLDALDKTRLALIQKKYPERPLETVLAEFGSFEDQSLSEKDIELIQTEYKQLMQMSAKWRSESPEMMKQQIHAIKQKACSKPLEKEDQLMILVIARERLRVEFSILPYNVQLLTVLALLHIPEKCKGRIAQVKTGEGKSTIIALLSTVLACQNQCVDIITSSRYLAIRDQQKYAQFYRYFDVTSSHICIDNPNQECFEGQILFGTNTDFEFSILREGLMNSGLRRSKVNGVLIERPQDAVIVDEIDNLLIDKAGESARIATNTSQPKTWIYPLIYDWISERSSTLTMKKEWVLSIRQLLSSHLEGRYKYWVETLTDFQIQKWISSAWSIIQEKYNENVQYVIKQDSIIIVDEVHTGRLHENSRWQGGLHEFLEYKHKLPIKDENLTSASISHPPYFNQYLSLFGLTGTMGYASERKEVEKVYKIDSFNVPTYQPSLRSSWDPIYVDKDHDFFPTILSEIKNIVEKKRAILILCPNIEKSLLLSAFLVENQLKHNVLNAVQQEDEDYIIARAGHPKSITIATNTAGRGTDIILTPELKEAGGLHVIFTFYPDNARVEAQGVGRSGRQGQKGSSRIILSNTDPAVLDLHPRTLLAAISKRLGHALGFEIDSDIPILPTFTDPQSLFRTLEEQRIQKVECESQRREVLSKIAALDYQILKRFFLCFKQWHEALSDNLLSDIARSLSNIKASLEIRVVTQEAIPFFWKDTELKAIFDWLIANNAQKKTHSSWITLLGQIKNNLSEKIREVWAVFYTDLDDLKLELQYERKETPDEEFLEIANSENLKQIFAFLETFVQKPRISFLQMLEQISEKCLMSLE